MKANFKIKNARLLAFLCTFLLLLNGCSREEPISEADTSLLSRNNSNGILHHVSFGGNDYCGALGLPNGCDRSFSITADMRQDGTVTGQWQDGFGNNVGGIHVRIDCMTINGNYATVGGYVIRGSIDGFDLAGTYAVTAMVDNGTSSNDVPDQISFSYTEMLADYCDYPRGQLELLDLRNGQVVVW